LLFCCKTALKMHDGLPGSVGGRNGNGPCSFYFRLLAPSLPYSRGVRTPTVGFFTPDLDPNPDKYTFLRSSPRPFPTLSSGTESVRSKGNKKANEEKSGGTR